jgi:hypothetical protein
MNSSSRSFGLAGKREQWGYCYRSEHEAGNEIKPASCILAIGLRAKSGGDLCDSLASINIILAKAPKGVRCVALGDWNFDPTDSAE